VGAAVALGPGGRSGVGRGVGSTRGIWGVGDAAAPSVGAAVGAGVVPRGGLARGVGGETTLGSWSGAGERGRPTAPELVLGCGSRVTGDVVGAGATGTDSASGARVVDGVVPADESAAGGVSIAGVSMVAGVRPGVAPKAATASAATTTHAVAAASPIRPARRRGRGPAAGPMGGAEVGGSTGGCDVGSEAAGGRRAGCCHAARRSTAGPSTRGSARKSRYGSAAACVEPTAVAPPPVPPTPADPTAIRRAAGWSVRRNGAHFRQAPSTRFQQSAQQAAPHCGQSRYAPRADVTVSRSRPQRSQNWVPRSTIHSTPAQSPGGCATLPTIGSSKRAGARRWYRDRAAFVSFGALRHQRACRPAAASRRRPGAPCATRSTLRP